MATARFVQSEPVRLDVELALTREEADELPDTLFPARGSGAVYAVLRDLLNPKQETTTR